MRQRVTERIFAKKVIWAGKEFLKEAAVMKEIKHPNLVQLLGEGACLNHGFPQRCLSPNPCCPQSSFCITMAEALSINLFQ